MSDNPDAVMADAQDAEKRLMNKWVALLAAGAAWGGMSAVKARNTSVLESAEDFLRWLETEPF